MVLVQYESADCKECNEVADHAFEDKDLAASLSRDFICIKISPAHADRATIASLYSRESESFGTLFIDADKNLVHQYPASTTISLPYIKQAELALQKASGGKSWKALEQQIKNGAAGIETWEQLLQERRTLSLPTDSLLNVYVQMLPADSLQAIRTLQFIAGMAPELKSLADSVLRKDRVLFDKAWYGLNLQKRISINNSIIRKSMQRAIREQNESLALAVANFAKSTFSKNQEGGAKSFDRNMLRYYEQTGDTVRFFTKSVAYYERYFMQVNPDAVKRNDTLREEQLRQTAKKDTQVVDGKVAIRTVYNFAPNAQNFTRELTEGAAKFYQLTRNPFLISIATEWVRRGLQFYDLPEGWEVYARLLYRQGQQYAAVEAINKAIALRKENGFPAGEQEALLREMKKGTTHID